MKVAWVTGICSLLPSKEQKWDSMVQNGIWKLRAMEWGMPPTYRANILPFTFFFNAQKWKARKINF
jgi:hypothetical protein